MKNVASDARGDDIGVVRRACRSKGIRLFDTGPQKNIAVETNADDLFAFEIRPQPVQ